MSAEKIIEQITKDTTAEIQKIQKETDAQVKQIISAQKQQAQDEAEKIVADGEKQSDSIKKIQISQAHQEVKRDIMNAKEKLIENCFSQASEKLAKLSDSDYTKIVTSLMQKGADKLGKNCSVVISKELDRTIAKKLGLTVSGEQKSSGGILLVSNDSRITLDNTFEGIIKREKQKIRIHVGKLLFS